jgi:hypothetical protein
MEVMKVLCHQSRLDYRFESSFSLVIVPLRSSSVGDTSGSIKGISVFSDGDLSGPPGLGVDDDDEMSVQSDILAGGVHKIVLP